MKLINYCNKTDGNRPDLAWIVLGRLVSGNVTENLKPVYNGFYAFIMLPFKKIMTYTCSNTFLEKKGLCRWRIGLMWRKPNIRKTKKAKTEFFYQIVKFPTESP